MRVIEIVRMLLGARKPQAEPPLEPWFRKRITTPANPIIQKVKEDFAVIRGDRDGPLSEEEIKWVYLQILKADPLYYATRDRQYFVS